MCETCFLDQTRKIYSTALTEKYLSTTQELITRGENVTWLCKSCGPVVHLSPCRSAEYAFCHAMSGYTHVFLEQSRAGVTAGVF